VFEVRVETAEGVSFLYYVMGKARLPNLVSWGRAAR
jgi:hypothetical protein